MGASCVFPSVASLMGRSVYLFHIQYDPLMMQQKEARRKHTCVLPKKVAFLV